MYSNNSNQNLFINGELVSGLTTLNLTYDTNITPSFYINDSGLNYIPSQPIRANLALNLIGNSNDPFINYTGNRLFSGRIEYYNRYINFTSGAVTSYNLRYSKSSPVETSVSAVIFGEVGSTTGNYNIINYSQNLPIYDYNYVDIDLDEFEQNRAQSFDLSIACNRNETYEIGSYNPSYIQLIYPINISLYCDLEINEFNYEDIKDILNNISLRNLNINLKRFNSLQTARSFRFNNLILSNKNMTLSSQDNGRANLGFVGFITTGES